MTELCLNACDLGQHDCIKIAASPKVLLLKTLDISCNQIGFEGLCDLLDPDTSNLGNLEELELYNCSINPAFGAQRPDFKPLVLELNHLRYLNLSHNAISGLLHFFSESFFNGNLETLILIDIMDHKQESECVHAWLIQCLPMLTGLKKLDVSQNANILVDKLLQSIQTSQMTAL